MRKLEVPDLITMIWQHLQRLRGELFAKGGQHGGQEGATKGAGLAVNTCDQ